MANIYTMNSPIILVVIRKRYIECHLFFQFLFLPCIIGVGGCIIVMQEGETYLSVFQRLLASSQLQPLSKFKSYKSLNLTYPDALKYPEFFNNNLLAAGRVIKVVRGRSALIRAFCYQLMKLTFEIEVLDIDYVDIFKSVIFLPDLLLEDSEMQSPSSGRTHTDRQYKRILADFVELMAQQSIPNFELTVMEYPVVEEAITRTIEALVNRCYEKAPPYDTEELLDWLSKTFQLNVERHGNCYRFEESDVFLYEQNQEEFYITYLNEMAEVSDYSESTHRIDGRRSQEDEKLVKREEQRLRKDYNNSSPESQRTLELDDYKLPIYPSDRYRYSAQVYARRTEDPAPAPNPYRRTIDNLEFIKDLGREVDESVHNDKPSDKHSKIGSLLDIMSDRSSKDLSQPYRAEQASLPSDEDRRVPSEKALHGSRDSQQLTPQFTTNLYLQEEHYNPFTKKYSELYMGHLYDRNHFDPPTHAAHTSHFQTYSNANDYKFDNNNYKFDTSNHYPLQNGYEKYQAEKNQYQPPSSYTFHPYSNGTPKNVLIDSLEDFKPIPAEEESIFYKPKSSKRFDKSTVTKGAEEKEESRGTLYRQFTDTRVLQFMPSMERQKINQIRKKYKGMHRKDLRNLY